MATRSQISQSFSVSNTVNRYVSIWTIGGWSAYLKKKERSPLQERLRTGRLSWKLKLDCNLNTARKPDSAGLYVLAEPERETAAKISADGCCSLLGLKSEAAANPRRQTLWKHGKSWAIVMDLPAEDALATQQLDEIKIRIELDMTESLSSSTLTIEEMMSLPKKAFDRASTDTAIEVDGRVIPVHRSVLADSSPIFESLLRAASWKRLALPDVDILTAKEVLKFAYTKREPDFQRMDDSAVFDLLIAAEKYGLEKLKEHAADHIAYNSDHAEAIDLLLEADRSGNLFVKEMVLLYIKNNKQLISKDEFGRLKNHHDLMVEILDVICS